MLNAIEFVKKAASEVGYKEEGTNLTKYARFFDITAWQYFNTKKQGASWCSIFLHWCIYKISDADSCRKFFSEPAPKNNCGAGVKYLYQYMMKGEVKISGAAAGDIIFLNDFSHVGMVEKVDDKKIYTIEGNSSNSVKRHSYARSSKKISAICRGIYPKSSTHKEEKPSVYKTASASSFNRKYNKNYILIKDAALMTGISKNPIQAQLKKGDKVRCYGFYTGNLLYVLHGSTPGFISRSYLKEV